VGLRAPHDATLPQPNDCSLPYQREGIGNVSGTVNQEPRSDGRAIN
jgi:hypothetical protein